MRLFHATMAAGLLLVGTSAFGQAVRSVSHAAPLRSDPTVGNVQRYGRTLKSDPDDGVGFSYHVFPLASNVIPVGGAVQPGGAGTVVSLGAPSPVLPYILNQPTDTTAFRNPPSVNAQGVVSLASPDGALNPAISHQPLIQVKVRVVEVDRTDSLSHSSVLDYVSLNPATAKSSYISGNNINGNKRNTSGGSRFSVPGQLALDATGMKLGGGAGLLLNMTSKHINYIASFLAREFNADVVTAPQVTTLNGQNVEFTTGDKVPFELGQNVVGDGTNNIQQFFYKHVGTYISVTPQIVNWGVKHQGHGRARRDYARPDEIAIEDVQDWTLLMKNLRLADEQNTIPKIADDFKLLLKDPPPLDSTVKASVIAQINNLMGQSVPFASAKDPKTVSHSIVNRLYLESFLPLTPVDGRDACGAGGCNWKPSDCTIDLALVVRLSSVGGSNVTAPDRNGTVRDRTVNTETNVRAIANVVQVKSGEGVVMAGLIGERDVQDITKVPVLGDIPYIGALFRSKITNRAKTETLIFVEAQVLDSDPATARCQSYRDLQLGAGYVSGNFLDNPLEFGMHRAGFGSYLPPNSCEEKIFWERMGRTIRKVATEVDDVWK